MKILQIIHCFPPESMTGAEIYAYNLSKELSKKHKVSVFYRIKNPKATEYKIVKDNYSGLDVYKINNTLKDCNSLDGMYKNQNIENAFLEVLDEVKPDVAHIHHLVFLSIGIIDELKKRKIPVVFTLHDYWLVCPRGQLLKSNLEICKNPRGENCLCCISRGIRLKNLLRRLLNLRTTKQLSRRPKIDLDKLFKEVDLFIAPSKFLRDRFIEFGIPQEKIIYSDNSMDLGLFEGIKKTGSDKVRFAFIGTLIPSKGIHILIRASNKLNRDKAVLKIYGNSPVNNGIFDYYHRIRRIAGDNIKFMGIFDNKDAAKVFSEIDVLVFPSIWHENSPLVLKEAYLSRTPVIASQIGGVPEFVKDGVSGLLFKAGDKDDLYKKMSMFIDDRELAPKISSRTGSLNIVKTIENNSLEIENIYNNLTRND